MENILFGEVLGEAFRDSVKGAPRDEWCGHQTTLLFCFLQKTLPAVYPSELLHMLGFSALT